VRKFHCIKVILIETWEENFSSHDRTYYLSSLMMRNFNQVRVRIWYIYSYLYIFFLSLVIPRVKGTVSMKKSLYGCCQLYIVHKVFCKKKKKQRKCFFEILRLLFLKTTPFMLSLYVKQPKFRAPDWWVLRRGNGQTGGILQLFANIILTNQIWNPAISVISVRNKSTCYQHLWVRDYFWFNFAVNYLFIQAESVSILRIRKY